MENLAHPYVHIESTDSMIHLKLLEGNLMKYSKLHLTLHNLDV